MVDHAIEQTPALNPYDNDEGYPLLRFQATVGIRDTEPEHVRVQFGATDRAKSAAASPICG